MTTDSVQKWIDNAEKGIARGNLGYVLKSSKELKKLGETEQAEAVLRRALEEFIGEVKLITDLCSIIMDRDPSEVLELTEMSAEKDSGILVMKATALGHLGRSDEAIPLLENEIALDSNLRLIPDVVSKLATLYLSEGMDQEAVDLLAPLLEQGHFRKHRQIRQMLADAYIKTRHPDKALELVQDFRDQRSRWLARRAEEMLGSVVLAPPGKPLVFVIHGHDMVSVSKLELLLRRIGAEPLVFSQLPKGGSTTIIEILEEHIPSADAIIALLTPDDEGRERGKRSWELRARENVLIEAGYGVISRRRRSLLIALGGVHIPSDFDGIHTIQEQEWSHKVETQMAKRLSEMGLNVDLSKAM